VSVKTRDSFQSGYDALDPSSRSVVDEVLRRYGIQPQSGVQSVLGAAGSVLGAGADAMASNRGSMVDVMSQQEVLNQQRQRDYRSAVHDREQDRRAGGDHAWRAMQAAEYLQNATGYTPRAGMGSFGFGPKAATDAEKRGAAAYSAEAMRRLERGDSMLSQITDPGQFQFDPKHLSPGVIEQLMNVGGVASTVAGAVPGSTWGKVGKGIAKGLGKVGKFFF
jgi:hypothetical protein